MAIAKLMLKVGCLLLFVMIKLAIINNILLISMVFQDLKRINFIWSTFKASLKKLLGERTSFTSIKLKPVHVLI